MFLRQNAWWNWRTWNTLFGCLPVDARCLNCWAAKYAGTVIAAHDVEQYRGLTFDQRDFAGAAERAPGLDLAAALAAC
jgi:protein gp37